MEKDSSNQDLMHIKENVPSVTELDSSNGESVSGRSDSDSDDINKNHTPRSHTA